MCSNNKKKIVSLILLTVVLYVPTAVSTQDPVNIANRTIVSASSTLEYEGFNYNPQNVIDGNNQTSPEICNCCWSSKNETLPALTLHLPQKHLISSIEIMGRSDQLKNVPRILSSVNIAVDGIDMTHDQHLVGNDIHLDVTQSVSNITITRPRPTGQTEWYLVICEINLYSQGLDIIHGVAHTIQVEQSSVLYNNRTTSGPHNAIDEHGTVDIHACPCCSVTDNAGSVSWWQIDLGQQYFVQAIQVFGRAADVHSEYNKQLEGAVVYAGNTSMIHNQDRGVVIYTLPTMNATTRHFTKILDATITSQYFIVELNRPVLTLCEFKVFGLYCPVGFYGDGCSSRCHCKDAVGCLKNNGTCPDGCEFGWEGDSCSTDLKIIAEIRHVVAVTQSSIFWNKPKSFGPYNAIDGVDNYDVDTCGCCSVTADPAPDTKSWWQIDLGQQYLVKSLQIYGRSYGSNDQLQGAIVYAGNTSLIHNQYGRMKIYTVPTMTDTTRHFTKILDNAIISQNFLVELSGSPITLCEFKLFKQVCHVGMFGFGCSHVCHCHDNQTCDSVTGECQTPGCYPGWNGTACDQECIFPTFGDGCINTCHCTNGTHCDHVSGLCNVGKCDPGWQGGSCSQESIQHQTNSVSMPVVVGSVVGGFIVILIVVITVVLFVLYKKRAGSLGTGSKPDENRLFNGNEHDNGSDGLAMSCDV